jgi:hypothetical protein
MNLCACDNESERGVGTDVNDTILLMTGTDLLDGDIDTPPVSRRSEPGQRILCVKEDHRGKHVMWYGVVCKTVTSSCGSDGCSLGGGRDTFCHVSAYDISSSISDLCL